MHFENKFPDLKYTTVCEWRKAIIVTAQKDHKQIIELEEKREKATWNLISFIMQYIRAIHDAGGIINMAIVIAAALGIVKKVSPGLLECNGVTLCWKKLG